MQLDNSLISRLEKLARLQLPEAERAALLEDLNQILEMVEKINSLDTSGVAPLAYPVELEHLFRKDETSSHLMPEQALQNAPKHDEQFFQVPKIIE